MNETFRYIGKQRRTKEDPRFVMGHGRFVADIALPGMKHVALVASPYPSARIVSIKTDAALALPGVHYVLTGEEFCDATDALAIGVDAPKVMRYSLARDVVRYAGEWVAAVVADTRAIAEDAVERVEVEYEPTPHVVDPELAVEPSSPQVHPAHGSNVILHKHFVWGPVDEAFAAAEHKLALRAVWGRSSTVPIETFGVAAQWQPGLQMLDIWASIQMPKFPDQAARALRLPGNAVRVHYDVDVGGSYGVKRGIKHTVLVGYLAKRLGMPVRLIEDRLENMRGGDMHGPDRIFDMQVAFDSDGTLRALKIRALDDVGAYAGRSPFQLGKPVTAICGPYRIGAIEYEPIAVLTNKTPEEAVRGFGQAPTNFALERTLDSVARHLNMDPIELRRRNLIRKDEFPYLIPSGSTYDSGDYHAVLDKALKAIDHPALVIERDSARRAGKLAGIGISTCLEPNGGNSGFEPLLNPKNDTTTWMDSCLVRVDLSGAITGVMGTSSSGQGHETLVSTVIGEILERDPADIRVVRADSLQALPSNSPVGSRMAIMLGGAAAGAARKIKETLIDIAAHNLGCTLESVEYENGNVSVRGRPDKRMTWDDLIAIAHRKIHQMPRRARAGFTGEVCMGSANRRRAAGRRRDHTDLSVLFVRSACRLCRNRRRYRSADTSQVCVRPRLRRHDHARHRARHDLWRHRAWHRRRALRKIQLYRGRPARERHLHGLSAAERDGSAVDHDRRSLHAFAAHDVRPERLGRSRLSRRACGYCKCDQRCVSAAQRAHRHTADDARCAMADHIESA